MYRGSASSRMGQEYVAIGAVVNLLRGRPYIGYRIEWSVGSFSSTDLNSFPAHSNIRLQRRDQNPPDLSELKVAFHLIIIEKQHQTASARIDTCCSRKSECRNFAISIGGT